jgi:hypothetical protein
MLLEGAVYLLCAATALACAVLLLRGFKNSGTRLLLWCGLCFLGLTLENGFLFIDLIVFPEVEFPPIQGITSLIGAACLMYGLIWETR